MDETKKVVIISVFLLILGLFLGWWFGRGSSETKVIEKVDTTREHEKIDSLLVIIKETQEKVDSLKGSVTIIREIQYKEIEKIKSLPVDSSVALLRANLEASPLDTLPRIISTHNDTTVEISSSNVRDINVTYQDLRSEKEVTKTQAEIIKSDSVIIAGKDGIISEKGSIIDKQNQNIGQLEKALKKEKRRKNRQTFIAGSLAVILGLLNFVH